MLKRFLFNQWFIEHLLACQEQRRKGTLFFYFLPDDLLVSQLNVLLLLRCEAKLSLCCVTKSCTSQTSQHVLLILTLSWCFLKAVCTETCQTGLGEHQDLPSVCVDELPGPLVSSELGGKKKNFVNEICRQGNRRVHLMNSLP